MVLIPVRKSNECYYIRCLALLLVLDNALRFAQIISLKRQYSCDRWKGIYFNVVQLTMPRKSKFPYFFCFILIVISITTCFAGSNGWCVDQNITSEDTHIELSDCHSILSVYNETVVRNLETKHSTGNKHCTTCYDITPDVLAIKLLDDLFESHLFVPSLSTIYIPLQYSELESFSIASSGGVVAIYQSFSLQNPLTIAIRTVVLLI